MEYRAVQNRCAVEFSDLKLPISDGRATEILVSNGFRIIAVHLIDLARSQIGKSVYRRGAHPQKAPGEVDCSGFMKWLYGEKGIWLPRRSIQQRDGGNVVGESDLVAGDLVFTSGHIDYYYDDPKDGVGHVGIATERKTVIHAAGKEKGVVETPFEEFVGKEKNKLRGVRRYIQTYTTLITIESSPQRIVETSSDFRWIILQLL